MSPIVKPVIDGNEVCVITDRKQWNDFLACHPQGHLLQSYEWGALHQFLGARIYRLGVIENGRMVGAMMLSVATVPLPFPGIRFNWLYCCRGPVVDSPDSPALPALIKKAHTIARKERAVVLRLEPAITEDDPAIAAWLQAYCRLGFQTNPIAVHGRSNWVLDLSPDLSQLHANFRKAWRQNIRIAENMGVTVREATSSADFDSYYELLKQTSQRDHFFIHDKAYHQEILRQFAASGNAVLFIAEQAGEPVAAKMLLRFGNCCWDMFAGTSNSKATLPKSHILQYHSLRWAKEQGCRYFDFRTIPDVLKPDQEMWGVYHYKKGFGGFVRRYMPTQDYVYRPLIYYAWRFFVIVRRTFRWLQYRRQQLRT